MADGLGTKLYLPEIVKGLAVTGRHLVRNLLNPKGIPTISYPEERRTYSERFRGAHVLKKRDDGSLRCVACYLCATACPALCITIEAGEYENPGVEKFPTRFEIDMLRCIFCGFCVEACPEDAIEMTGTSELCMTDRSQSTWDIRKLAERDELAESKPGFRPFYGEMEKLSPRSREPRKVRHRQESA